MTKQNNFKKSRNVLSTLFIFGLLLQGCGSASSGSNPSSPAGQDSQTATNEPNYFEELATATDRPPEGVSHPVRFRMVKADIAALKQSIQTGRKTLRLDLFKDKSVTVAVEDVQKISENNFVVTGHIDGQELSSASLVIRNDVVSANIHQPGGDRFSIDSQAGGAHAVVEAEDTATPDECATPEAPAAAAASLDPAATSVAEDSAATDAQALSATPVIDMLVAYTPQARAAAGGTNGILAKIQMGIADTNRAYANSGVRLSVRLAGTMEVRQNETGNFSNDLRYLQGKTDGRWDEVHARRAQLGADQVTMVGVYPGQTVAGIANIRASASSAFSVVKLSAFSIYTFSHELGHNIGLQHSDGYVNSSGRFRTIMAYGSVPRILRFSNPSLRYSNFATGDSYHNSARILNANGASTASLLISRLTSTTSMAASLTSSEAPLMSTSTEAQSETAATAADAESPGDGGSDSNQDPNLDPPL